MSKTKRKVRISDDFEVVEERVFSVESGGKVHRFATRQEADKFARVEAISARMIGFQNDNLDKVVVDEILDTPNGIEQLDECFEEFALMFRPELAEFFNKKSKGDSNE